MYEYTIGVEGMKCHMCEKHLIETLNQIGKLKRVKASFEKRTVSFDFDDLLEQEAVFAAVKEAGYQPISFIRDEVKGLTFFR